MLRTTDIWRQVSRFLLSSDGRLLTSASMNVEPLERREFLSVDLPGFGRRIEASDGSANDRCGQAVAVDAGGVAPGASSGLVWVYRYFMQRLTERHS